MGSTVGSLTGSTKGVPGPFLCQLGVEGSSGIDLRSCCKLAILWSGVTAAPMTTCFHDTMTRHFVGNPPSGGHIPW
jgi:hypothetical protein